MIKKIIKKVQHLCLSKLSNVNVRYKDIHLNDSCILIGNGSSVKIDDLNKIATFGFKIFVFNRFHKSFDIVNINPDYTVVTDPAYLKNFFYETFYKSRGKLLIGTSLNNFSIKYIFSSWFNLVSHDKFRFSHDMSSYIECGGSVVVATLQIAKYMGFKNIYLYGIDHSFNIVNSKYDTDFAINDDNHFIKNYRSGKEWRPPDVPLINEGFHKSFEILKFYNIQLVNLSRKSKLRKIPKKNFDTFCNSLKK